MYYLHTSHAFQSQVLPLVQMFTQIALNILTGSLVIGMHWISGSRGKLLDSELYSLLIYCVLFCNLICISTSNLQYMHSFFHFDQCVCVCVCVVICHYVHAKLLLIICI